MKPALIVLSVLTLAACDEKASQKAAASSSAASEVAAADSAAASAAPSAAPSAAVDAKPRSKETTASAADKLGTLPDGLGLAVGSQMPEITLTDSSGESVELSKLTAKGKAMLVFYRGGWCPFCNFQIRSLTTGFPEFQKRHVTPVAISVDKQSEAAKTSNVYEIPFPVLSDPELVAHKAFKVLNEVPDEELKRLKGFGIDLEASSGKEHHTIAVPAIFIVDTGGKIVWAHADTEYKTRPSNEQLLAVIDGLK